MVSCRQLIQDFVEYSERNFACEKKGVYIVLTTPFAYYDGDMVQVFIRELSDSMIEISDLGHAVRKLNAAGIEIARAPSRRNRMDAISRSRGIEYDRGRLITYCSSVEFSAHLIRLIQAMLQTDDLSFSRSTYAVRTFSSEIEDQLRDSGIGYKKPKPLHDAFNQRPYPYDFDFQLELPILTMIKGLSSVTDHGARDQYSRLFTALHALKPNYLNLETIVLIDESTEISWDTAERLLATVEPNTPKVFHLPSERDSFSAQLNTYKQLIA